MNKPLISSDLSRFFDQTTRFGRAAWGYGTVYKDFDHWLHMQILISAAAIHTEISVMRQKAMAEVNRILQEV